MALYKYILNFDYRNKEYVKSIVHDNYDFYHSKLINGVLLYDNKKKIDKIDTYIENDNIIYYEIDSKFIENKSILDDKCDNKDGDQNILENFKYINSITNLLFNKLFNNNLNEKYFELLKSENLDLKKEVISFLQKEFNLNQTNFISNLNILKEIDFRNLFDNQDDKYIFTYNKILDIKEGIYLYNNKNQHSLVIKYENFKNTDQNIERKIHYDILEKITNNNLNDLINIYSTSLCNTISSLYIGSYLKRDSSEEGLNLFLMPATSGELKEFTNFSDINSKYKIDLYMNLQGNSKLSTFFIKLLDQIICLYNKNLYYWNMDTKNILYLCGEEIDTCKFMFGNLGSLNLSYGTYNIWPFYYEDSITFVKKIYKEASHDLKSKYLAYIFIVTIIVPFLFWLDKDILLYHESDKEILSEIATYIYNDNFYINSPGEKLMYNNLITKHNKFFDLNILTMSEENRTKPVEGMNYQKILNKCKIPEIVKPSLVTNYKVDKNYFYNNLLTLDELRENLKKI